MSKPVNLDAIRECVARLTEASPDSPSWDEDWLALAGQQLREAVDELERLRDIWGGNQSGQQRHTPSDGAKTPMCHKHPAHFMPCNRCRGDDCAACDRQGQSADEGGPIWRHARWYEPHPAKVTVGSEDFRRAQPGRLTAGCETCHEVLIAYCPDCFIGEPHACPHVRDALDA